MPNVVAAATHGDHAQTQPCIYLLALAVTGIAFGRTLWTPHLATAESNGQEDQEGVGSPSGWASTSSRRGAPGESSSPVCSSASRCVGVSVSRLVSSFISALLSTAAKA